MSFNELRRIHEECAQMMLDYQTYRFGAVHRDAPVELQALLDLETQRINRRLEAVLHWLLQTRRRAEGAERLDRLRFAPERHLQPVPEVKGGSAPDLPHEVGQLLKRSAELVRRVEALSGAMPQAAGA